MESVTITEIPNHSYKGECQLKRGCHRTATHYVNGSGRGRQACPHHAAVVMAGKPTEEQIWDRQLNYERKIDEAADYATNWE